VNNKTQNNKTHNNKTQNNKTQNNNSKQQNSKQSNTSKREDGVYFYPKMEIIGFQTMLIFYTI